ncbi:hypothetical protein [Sphingomonas sp. M1A8_2b]
MASTALIKSEVPNYVAFTPIDLKPSSTRLQEQKWQQIVGNVVSHKTTTTSIFAKGYAERTVDGIRVTDAGINYLTKLGY